MTSDGRRHRCSPDLRWQRRSRRRCRRRCVYTVDRDAAARTDDHGAARSGRDNVGSATFSLASNDTGAACTYLCKLDSGSYAACTNPATFSGLADGSHTLSVEAKDAAGNVSTTAASRTWTVDATPPPKPGIVGPNNKSDSTAATFTFSDSEADVTYECNLDGGAYMACPNPKTYTLLTPGTHEVDVEPVDAAGNVSAIQRLEVDDQRPLPAAACRSRSAATRAATLLSGRRDAVT